MSALGLARALHVELGGFRTRLCWRVFGIALYQVSPLTVGPLAIAGLALALFGPRLWSLAGALAAASSVLARLSDPDEAGAIPEEFGPFVALPAFAIGASIWLLATRRTDQLDTLHVSLFRIGAVCSMGFSAFHKLNADFFAPEVSCATLLGENLDALWAIPLHTLGVLPSPVVIVAGEGLSALLLLTYPIVGLVFTVAMMTPIAMFGPTALTTTIYAMALAFLRDEDGALLREALGRHWRGLLAACVVAAAAVLWLLVGVQHFRFAIYAVFVATLLVGLSRVIADRWRSGSALRNLRPQLPRPGRMAGSTRALVGSFALLALANGLSPYVGPKFRLSMAMFSNLRVDDERWNHLLVPRALHLAEGDGHVHVTHVEKSRATRHRQAQLRQHHERAFDPGLYTPASFATRLQTLRATRGRANVTLTWRGKRYVFSDAANSAGLAWLVGTLPRNSKWFQSALAAHGPQPCVH